MNRKLQVAKYILLDWIAATMAWFLFYIFRKQSEDPHFTKNTS